jgi:outer membrane protein assembly factor BamD (BamD/ComL family)
MSERYSKLYALPSNQYAAGAPVIIAAGSLLKDNQTGTVLAQLKIQNISDTPVKAAKIKISIFDTVGRLLGECVEYQYLDLCVKRDDFFGQKTPVPIPDSATRSFSVSVTEVAFLDNSVWSTNNEPWDALPSPTSLEDKLGRNDSALLQQYHLKYGSDCKYWPTEEKDLWYCACGGLNHSNEPNCHVCKKSLEEQLGVDIETLKAERDARLEREAAELERKVQEAKQRAEEKAAQDAKRKKQIRIATAVAAAVIIVAVAVGMVTTKVIIPNHNYNKAVSLMDAGNYDEAITAFEAMDGYKDSAAQITECKNLKAYHAAAELMDSGDYPGAITAFEALGDYSDCADKAEECAELQNEADYQAALALMNDGRYQNAISAFEKLGDFSDSAEKIEECTELQKDADYQAALALMESGSYMIAISSFEDLGDYADCEEKIVVCKKMIMMSASVGDEVTFGSYEQDNDRSNGSESIKWIVLAKEDSRILVISKYALDTLPFNTSSEAVNWETCSLRTYLNGAFFDKAFSDLEQESILTTTVLADENPYYGTEDGNDTEDYLFLLSITEAEEYFGVSGTEICKARTCKPTAYAVAQGVAVNDEGGQAAGNSPWLLRTPSSIEDGRAYVTVEGYITGPATHSSGAYVDATGGGIRPAMWISIEE